MDTYQNLNNKNIKIRELLKDYISNLDENIKYFCRLVRQDLRDEKDYVIAITGYPGTGKSQLGSILGILIDFNYSFEKNICFIPTSDEIEKQYLELPMYSVLHIDEASRGMHKHKWQDRMQQKLNELYDTDREGHFLCTIMLMPRFQNFAENFRNFRIKYWININERGIAVMYKRDEDKDSKDPWHLEENYKLKQKRWGKKKIYDRDVPSIIKMEQNTINYWFYFTIPPLPKEVWDIYQKLKKESRIKAKEKNNSDVESYKEKISREKRERWNNIIEYKKQGLTHIQIAVKLGVSSQTIRRYIREIEEWNLMNGIQPSSTNKNKDIYNLNDKTNFEKIKVE